MKTCAALTGLIIGDALGGPLVLDLIGVIGRFEHANSLDN